MRQSSQRQVGGMACHHCRPVSGLHLQPQSPQGLAKKKKERERESTVIKHHTLLLSRPWEHTHRANALGGTKMLDHCPFPRPYNYKQLVQHLLCGLSGTGCFLRDLQVTGANHCSYH